MPNEIKRNSDDTRSNSVEEPKSPDTWRRMCKLANQTRQEIDSNPSSLPGDNKGKGVLSPDEVALQDKLLKSMPVGENGERAERVVNLVSEKGLGGVMGRVRVVALV